MAYKNDNPCRFCKDERHVGCHATCEKRSKWLEKHMARKDKIIKNKIKESRARSRSKATQIVNRKSKTYASKGLYSNRSYTKM